MIPHKTLLSFFALPALWPASVCAQSTLKADVEKMSMGEWDGKTLSSKLDVPYEDPHQTPPPFGTHTYFNQPWRGYMDTWPASKWLNVLAVGWMGGERFKYSESLAQLMSECGVRSARIEIGWGNIDWNDELPVAQKQKWQPVLQAFKKHGIRPLILLNAHHGYPAPNKYFETQLLKDAAKGDRIVALPADLKIRVGYTGMVNIGDYKAAHPLITRFDDDGTAHLSKPLPSDIKAGKLPLQELKYLPLQGSKLQDSTDVPASPESIEGWKKYALAVATFAREVLGTPNDSGFDLEVWNELTFGSDFLDINNYYEPKRQYAQPLLYRKTRAWSNRMRPDARLEFEQKGYEVLLPITIDLLNDQARGFKNVAVISGFSNQWPWGSGATQWDGQAGLSKHYYTGTTVREVSPEKPLHGMDKGSIDAVGNMDGKKPPNAREWWQIVPGSNFVPRARLTWPEWAHSGFQTETLQRDLFPDSRRAEGVPFIGPYGRYTHNGDFRTPRYWQTETGYDRRDFIEGLKKATGAKEDDVRLIRLNDWMNSKHMLRQYLFHAHKGFERIYLFSLDFNPFEIGLLPTAFWTALEKSNGALTPEVRAAVPTGWNAVKWVTQLMKSDTEVSNPRPLRVDALVEHKPRLVFAAEGTKARPHKWNRDYFAALPFQLSAKKFVVGYYVAFPNATHSWNSGLHALDAARYDLPDQEFDITIGNVAGRGARVSAFDPLNHKSVPVKVLSSTLTNLAVRVVCSDYPRFLIIEEAQDGPLILNPQMTAKPDGSVLLRWKSNVPVGAARVSYGRDWMFRDVNEIVTAIPKASKQNTPQSPLKAHQFAVTIPASSAPNTDMIAARIRISANGLNAVWPRWDEDPAGQLVLPNAQPRPARQTDAITPSQSTFAARLGATGTPISLPLLKISGLKDVKLFERIAMQVPGSATVAGAGDEQSITLGQGQEKLVLHARLITNGAALAADYLPFAAPADVVMRHAVAVDKSLVAVLIDYELAGVAHPGMTNLRQKYFLMPLSRSDKKPDDLLIFSVSGLPASMSKQDPTLKAILARVRIDS